MAQTPREMLVEAQMHMECMNEAFLELWGAGGMKKPSKQRQRVINEELSARVWAAIYLVQAVRDPEWKKPDNFNDTIREANAHNGLDYEDVDVTGMH
jgi:hypothetical protein